MARIKTIYKVMVNVWNGSRGIASDDYNHEYDGVEYTSEKEAKLIKEKARKETFNDLLVNYIWIDRIEVIE